MRNWILAAIIGLATCGQAWAWDDEERPFGNGRYGTMAEWREAMDAQEDLRRDRYQRQLNESQMLLNQEESLKNQKELLEIEKERLEMERERSRRDGWRD